MLCKLRRDAGSRCAGVNECLRAGTGELSLFIAGSLRLPVGRLDGPAREWIFTCRRIPTLGS